MNRASLAEVRIFILWPLGGVPASEHWSLSYECWLGSACVAAPLARLQAVTYALVTLWEVPTLLLHNKNNVNKKREH
jgi:hypothetical protein